MDTPRLSVLLALCATLALAFAGCSSPTSGSSDDDASSSDGPGGGASASGSQSGTNPPNPPGTGTLPKGPMAVSLGSAANYAILAKSGVSTTGTTTVIGDVGASPIDATAITGFGLVMDATNQFSTSSLVTGHVLAADYAAPTPTLLTQAIADMELAYADAANRVDPTATELGAGNIGGMTLQPGLYKWGTGLLIPTDLMLAGGSNDVWIFQVSQTLDLASGAEVLLSGGAQARNVFWQVAGQATLATGSGFQGTILSYNAVVLETGATLDGRALAQTAVTLDANAVTRP